MPRPRHLLLAVLLAGAPLATTSAHATLPTDSAVLGSLIGLGSQFDSRPDGSGGVFVAWSDARNGSSNYDIYAQHYDNKGNALWGSGTAVCTATGNQTSARVEADGFGGLYVVWVDARNYASTGDDIYASHLLSGGALAGGWTSNGTVVCLQAGEQISPSTAVDQNGNLFIAWMDGRNFATTDYDIAVQKFGSRGTASWGANGAIICNAAHAQTNPLIAPDLLGGAYVAWTDNRAGIDFTDVYYRTVSSAGVAGSPVNGTDLTALDGYDYLEALVPVNGNVAVIYTIWDGLSSYDVTYQLASGTGSYWTASLTNGLGANRFERAVSDGATGFFVAWQTGDPNNQAAYHQLVAQHVEGGWSSSYGLSGSLVCGGAMLFYYPAIVPDGTGGATIAWKDTRHGMVDHLFAQHLDHAGVPVWPVGGVPVQDGPYTVGMPQAVTDGSGGVLVPYGGTVASGGSFLVMLRRIDRFGRQGDASPAIVKVKDVPNDQGGHVSLQWTASYLDALPSQAVTQYTVWRRAPAAAAAAAAISRAAPVAGVGGAAAASAGIPFTAAGRRFVTTRDAASGMVIYWEQVAGLAARALPGYSFSAPTTSDSLPGTNPYTGFMVMAETSGGTQFWPSAPDSGYSVDNLPPLAPAPVAAAWQAGSMSLHWRANLEADLAGYRVYRGTSAAFTPSAANRVADQPDTALVDPAGTPSYYKISAVDAHGNESAFTLVSPAGIADVGPAVPPAFAFAPPSPNPASRNAELRWTLPADREADVAVFDASGRLVRVLASGAQGAGEHHAGWALDDASGRRVAPGLYLARLRAGADTRVQRIVVTR